MPRCSHPSPLPLPTTTVLAVASEREERSLEKGETERRGREDKIVLRKILKIAGSKEEEAGRVDRAPAALHVVDCPPVGPPGPPPRSPFPLAFLDSPASRGTRQRLTRVPIESSSPLASFCPGAERVNQLGTVIYSKSSIPPSRSIDRTHAMDGHRVDRVLAGAKKREAETGEDGNGRVN
uniref:Uncharacterized protein n=1 Tax=Oryza punctata TaxID=4537 RepID=A0A0E0JWF4_ORYPU